MIVNPKAFDYEDIVLLGSESEIEALFCVCATYNIRPRHYVADGGAGLSEIFGEPLAETGGSSCVKAFANRDLSRFEGVPSLLYHPTDGPACEDDRSLLRLNRRVLDYNPEIMCTGDASRNMLEYIGDDPDRGSKPRCFVFALSDIHEYRKTEPLRALMDRGEVFYDWRPMNEQSYYIGVGRSYYTVGVVPIRTVELRYRLGKRIFEKVSSMPGLKMMCSYKSMGDNFRELGTYKGIDYSGFTFLIPESGKALPSLLGVAGITVSPSEQQTLKMYLSMNEIVCPGLSIRPNQ